MQLKSYRIFLFFAPFTWALLRRFHHQNITRHSWEIAWRQLKWISRVKIRNKISFGHFYFECFWIYICKWIKYVTKWCIKGPICMQKFAHLPSCGSHLLMKMTWNVYTPAKGVRGNGLHVQPRVQIILTDISYPMILIFFYFWFFSLLWVICNPNRSTFLQDK